MKKVDTRWHEYLWGAAEVAWQTFEYNAADPHAVIAQLTAELAHENTVIRVRAALRCMTLAFGTHTQQGRTAFSDELLPGLVAMINSPAVPEQVTASWACAWLGQKNLLQHAMPTTCLLRWFGLWQHHVTTGYAPYFAWALSAQTLIDRDTLTPEIWGDCNAFLHDELKKGGKQEAAALVVMWYRRGPFNDGALITAIEKAGRTSVTRALLTNLGEAGHAVLERWKKESSVTLNTIAI